MIKSDTVGMNLNPAGFRLEGAILEDGGDVDFYEITPDLEFGERLLSYCSINRRNNLLGRKFYDVRIDNRYRSEILGNGFETQGVRDIGSAIGIVLRYIGEAADFIDPENSESIKVVNVRSGGLDEHINANRSSALNFVKRLES